MAYYAKVGFFKIVFLGRSKSTLYFTLARLVTRREITNFCMSFPDCHTWPILLKLPPPHLPCKLQLPIHLQRSESVQSLKLDIKHAFSSQHLWGHRHSCWHSYHCPWEIIRFLCIACDEVYTVVVLLLLEPRSHTIFVFVGHLQSRHHTELWH